MANKLDPLATYNAKRDFKKTAEPAGEMAEAGSRIFMVQKHDATRLHYDFRLEVDGVLKSWAVTRGPSLNPDDKRLAVRTEDHPLAYATFEGTIPKGEYGGGTVMLWDRGTWAPIAGKSAKDLEEGHLHFTLDGERMKGEWLLIRLKPRPKERTENWLLRKIDDAHVGGSDDLTGRFVTSVATERTMEEIAANLPAPAGGTEGPAKPSRGGRKRATALPGASRHSSSRGKDLPPFQPPQLATLVDAVPTGRGWLHEMKYDGYRALVTVGGGAAKVYTRSGLDWTDKFPDVAAAAATLPVASALIDGEIVALDAEGRPDFSTLQAAIKGGGHGLVFFAFDLLQLDGEDWTKRGNFARKDALRPLIAGEGPIRYAEHVVGKGEQLFEGLCAKGVEGVVSKKADAPYAGKRTGAWLKIKCTRRQEFVVLGWTESEARTRGFSSLLLGVNAGSGLRYAGKVGTGFDGKTLASIRKQLDALPEGKPPEGVPREVKRGAHWVAPRLVAEVAFAEFTADGVVRHASFVGLREDKPAAEVVREEPKKDRASTSSARTASSSPPPPPYRLTSPERVVDADSGLTKGELADYYATVAPAMLAVLGRRPVSLVRCPQGRAKQCFFQKHDAGSFGPTVHHVPVTEGDGDVEDYLWVDDAAGLMACVQMNTIEFHGWGSRVEPLEKPDRVIIDLDPDEGLDFDVVRAAALELRTTLADMGLVTFAMLSGGKGVHVVVPVTPDAEWPAVKDWARRFAIALEQSQPERYVANMAKAKRKGRIFVDYLRNQRGATAVMPYSARARPGLPVAAPITWEELRDVDKASRWSIRDGAELMTRARSRDLKGWGIADQLLPGV